jgi:glyoxylase-like metal-dependent hydrolase (beta-lactamase superfamily II)
MCRAVVRRVVVGPLRTNSWLVHGAGHREALLVDPGDEPGRLLAAVRQHDLEVRAVLLTHAHFDHVLGVPEVAAALGVPVLAHPADAAVWPGELAHLRTQGHWDAGTATTELLQEDPASLTPDLGRPLWDGRTEPVLDGDRLRLGPLTATVLHTPGHTPGGITVSVGGHLFTGDTLFPGGPGLTGSAWPDSDFGAVMASVDRLMTWPDGTVVHPGHGPDTTLGVERPHVDAWRARGW